MFILVFKAICHTKLTEQISFLTYIFTFALNATANSDFASRQSFKMKNSAYFSATFKPF